MGQKYIPQTHSIYGPSSSARLIGCPGSIKLIQSLPPEMKDTSSAFAAEGTQAHAICEVALRLQGDWQTAVANAKFEVPEEMADGARLYCETILADMETYPYATLQVEKRVGLPQLHPQLYGTADAVLLVPFYRGAVYDYKYGRGVVVDVEDNSQLKYYAAAAFYDEDIDEVEMVIIQPRAYHPDGPVRRATIKKSELVEWAQTTLHSAVQLAESDAAPRDVGDWCRFCPALSVCPEMRVAVMEQAQIAFAPGDTFPSKKPVLPAISSLNAVQIGQALELADMVEPWIKAVRKYAHEQIEQGEEVPGWKLVAGRAGNRKWISEEEAVKSLKPILGNDVYDTKPKSPAKMEKALKQRKADVSLMDGLIERADPKPVLVPASDPKPALQPGGMAALVFDDGLDEF